LTRDDSQRPPGLIVLRQRPEWSDAVNALAELADRRGDDAKAAAREYGLVYADRRGAMVFDVVASRQRNYKRRVLPMVDDWVTSVSAPTLAALAADPPDASHFGLTRGEPATMREVAANLLALTRHLALSEDDACKRWGDDVRALEHAHDLDPVVGKVAGIGPALFAYMRMRCGSDALKPDVRVGRGLRRLGFQVPADGHSILVVARAAAAEIGFDLLALDQLLWAESG
jgi:hypothetical protein